MPRQDRKPCSGWGRLAMIPSASLAVCGPVFSAQEMMREGSTRHGGDGSRACAPGR